VSEPYDFDYALTDDEQIEAQERGDIKSVRDEVNHDTGHHIDFTRYAACFAGGSWLSAAFLDGPTVVTCIATAGLLFSLAFNRVPSSTGETE
jgi:hypothetical protein